MTTGTLFVLSAIFYLFLIHITTRELAASRAPLHVADAEEGLLQAARVGPLGVGVRVLLVLLQLLSPPSATTTHTQQRQTGSVP
jgi:hypothetical protein